MTSLKKLIAVLAVTLPLAATAQQAAPPAAPLYQWYGTLNVNAQYVEISEPFKASPTATPTNIAGRVGVSVDSSNVGIRGTLDTGQFGLGVVYQCETSATLDGDGVSGICNRNSRLGLSHQYGTLFYGNWDSPYKAVWYGTKADDAFGNTDIYDAAGIMGSPGFKTRSSAGLSATGPAVAGFPTVRDPTVAPPGAGSLNPAATVGSATFNVRTANSITYFSPKVMGAQVKLQYGTNERANNSGSLTGALYSASANYERGPLSVLAAVERHDDWSGLNVVGAISSDGSATSAAPAILRAGAKSTVDTGIRVGAGYEIGTSFGATTIGAVWELLTLGYANTHNLPANAVKEASRQAVMVNLKHRMKNHEFRFRYEYADNGDCELFNPTAGAKCNSDIGMGAQNYALGYAYYLTSAAQVYAYATKIENERGASYTFATAGPAALTSTWSAGADPFGAGIGMRYAF